MNIDYIQYFIKFLNDNTTGISNLLIILGGFWSIFKFKEYLKDKRFKIYHKLIDDLVNENSQPGNVIKLDRQIATIYELRNYPNYYAVSKRILLGLKKQWDMGDKRLIKEIDLTLNYIDNNYFLRIWKRILKI